MWLKEPPSPLESSLDENLNFLYSSDNIYIMDNHLAAVWCWLQEIDVNKTYNLYHIDRHYDLLNCPNCVKTQIVDAGIDITNTSLDEYLNLKKGPSSNTALFRWDNNIRNLEEIYSSIYHLKRFATHKDEGYQSYLSDDENAIEIEDYELVQQVTDDIIDNKSNQWIINIDIDYFFLDDNQGNYYQHLSDAYIKTLINMLKEAKDNIAVITIAVSPECSGGWSKSLRIARMIAKILGVEFKLFP